MVDIFADTGRVLRFDALGSAQNGHKNLSVAIV
jgi:hypothetical protein